MAITKSTLEAKGIQISVQTNNEKTDYISLTDIARYKNSKEPDLVVRNWMRLRNTVEYLGVWESLNNPNFNPTGYERFKNESVENAFTLSPKKWKEGTNAIGIVSKAGRYGGGTYAHSDIAFKFASWLSVEFELYVIKEYQRLKQDEGHRLKLEWSTKRELTKINYKIHTDAIKEYLITENLTEKQIGYTYANEADVLNVALFNMTANDWRQKNPDLKGNIRDHADVYQLIVLNNLEFKNAELIEQGVPQQERLIVLRKIAVRQIKSVINSIAANRLRDSIENAPKTKDLLNG